MLGGWHTEVLMSDGDRNRPGALYTCTFQQGGPWQRITGRIFPLPSPLLVAWGAWKVLEGRITAYSQLKTGSIPFEFLWIYRRICILYC